MRNTSLLLLLICLLYSCSTSSKENSKAKGSNKEDLLEHYFMDLSAPKTKFTDIIESVELIRLEETEFSLLSRIRQVLWHQNRLIVNNGNREVFIFDATGNFVNKISRFGDGPEEYDRISELWIDDDRLSIYSRISGTIKTYTFDGAFISSTRIPSEFARMGHLLPLKDQYVIETNFSALNDSSRYKWVSLDKNFNVSGKYLPFELTDEEPPPHYSSGLPIANYKDGLLLFRSHSDTIYQFTNDSLTPLIHLDFGNNWHWKGHSRPTYEMLGKVETDDIPKAWEITAHISENYAYAKALIGMSHWEHFIIDRNSEVITRLDIRKNLVDEFEISPLKWVDNKLSFTLASADVAEFLSRLSKDRITYREGTSLSAIEVSENPVLALFTFKNND
ncbi:6-bladed beta-propeller [Roseivirga sp.]|uniref:6-bladed beta-propeller n=1 Tax=Roseivirga sp. TaxID=1964215 RepID=UPI003B8CDFA8